MTVYNTEERKKPIILTRTHTHTHIQEKRDLQDAMRELGIAHSPAAEQVAKVSGFYFAHLSLTAYIDVVSSAHLTLFILFFDPLPPHTHYCFLGPLPQHTRYYLGTPSPHQPSKP